MEVQREPNFIAATAVCKNNAQGVAFRTSEQVHFGETDVWLEVVQ